MFQRVAEFRDFFYPCIRHMGKGGGYLLRNFLLLSSFYLAFASMSLSVLGG